MLKHRIEVDITQQTLSLVRGDECLQTYSVSTAKNGAGEAEGSERTPRGKHRVAAKIGGGLSPAAALQGRRPTGEVWSQTLHAEAPERDWILSRILWLEGCENGINRGSNKSGHCVDSMRRYIYIHGTPDCETMGEPKSHGCVRMRNSDVIDLYNQVEPGTPVLIYE